MVDLKSEEIERYFFHVDVVENAVDSLETAASFLDHRDGLKWKWIGFALHHALYSFCIAVLEHGNYEWVLARGKSDEGWLCISGDDKRFKKSKRVFRENNSHAYTIKWEDTDEKPPDPKSLKHRMRISQKRLISFWSALARVQDSDFWMGRLICSRALTLSEEEWKSIEWLANNFRNDLTHFIPKFWSFSVAHVRKACFDFLRPIEFLVFESCTIATLSECNGKERVRSALAKLRENLGNQV